VVKQLYLEGSIILYGSLAGGGAPKDSYWDFLILIDKDLPEKRETENSLCAILN